jgi:carbon-monoxide dehydrogenase large subunit
MKFGTGQSVRRTEDIRFITGQGQYTDDLHFPNETSSRLPAQPACACEDQIHRHGGGESRARRGGGVDAGRSRSGRRQADGDDDAGQEPRRLVPERRRQEFPGEGSGDVRRRGRRDGRRRNAGAGDGRGRAGRDRLRTARRHRHARARRPRPQVWDEVPGNLCLDWADGKEDECDRRVRRRRAHVVSLDMVQNRVVVNSMETRNAIGLYDRGERKLHPLFRQSGIGRVAQQCREDFGRRAGESARRVARCRRRLRHEGRSLSRTVRCPGRGEDHGPAGALVVRPHGSLPRRSSRPRYADAAEGAFDKDGKILALRVTGTANLGGYLSGFAPFIPTLAGRASSAASIACRPSSRTSRLFLQHARRSTPIAARAGPRPPITWSGCWMSRRAKSASTGSSSAAAICITPDELPYKNWWGVVLRFRRLSRLLEEGLKRANHAGFAERRKQSEARGKKRGFGMAYYVEITAAAGNEPAAGEVHRQWRRRASCRHAIQRPGPRDRVRAGRGRAARRAVRERSP